MHLRAFLLVLILLFGLTLLNALYARSEHDRSLTNPYSGPNSVIGSVLGAAVARSQGDESPRNFWLREVGVVLVGGAAMLIAMRYFPQPRKQG